MMAALTLQEQGIFCDQYMECSGKKNRNLEVFIILTQKYLEGVDRIRGAFRT